MSRARRHLAFHKMHGLGNDFLVIDGVTHAVELTAETIAAWGDRHTGIGFDQLLLIEPPTSSEADFWFKIYNTDGSSAEQCGNGTRAVAMLARHLGLSKKAELTWQSDAGPVHTRFVSPQQIETTMTVPELALPQIPFDASAAREVDAQTNRFEIEGLKALSLATKRPSGESAARRPKKDAESPSGASRIVCGTVR